MDHGVPDKSVGADEFFSLALSRKRLRRADDDANGIRGLLDLDQHVRYVINERLLFEHNQRAPSSSV